MSTKKMIESNPNELKWDDLASYLLRKKDRTAHDEEFLKAIEDFQERQRALSRTNVETTVSMLREHHNKTERLLALMDEFLSQ